MYNSSMTRRPQATSWGGIIVAVMLALLFGGFAAIGSSVISIRGYDVGIYVILAAALLFSFSILLISTSRKPARNAVYIILLISPYISTPLPPGELRFLLFDAAGLWFLLVVVFSRESANADANSHIASRLGSDLRLPLTLLLPCVIFSTYFWVSLQTYIRILFLYAVFILIVAEALRSEGSDSLIKVLVILALLHSAAVIVEVLTGFNPTLQPKNVNQGAGEYIGRASGFFQDPQKAAQYLGCMVAALVVMLSRGRIAGSRWYVGLCTATLVLAGVALFLTGSRAAMMATAIASAVAVVGLNRWSAPARMAAFICAISMTIIVFWADLDFVRKLAATSVLDRFSELEQSLSYRVIIWLDTWEMFADRPLFGIGLGAFRDFLLDTRPVTRNFYGIGLREGVPYVPDQPESGYLKVVYEGGLVGVVAFGALGWRIIFRLHCVLRHGSLDARTDAWAAILVILVFATSFVTIFSLSDVRLSLLLAVFLAIIWSRSGRISDLRR